MGRVGGSVWRLELGGRRGGSMRVLKEEWGVCGGNFFSRDRMVIF